LEICAKVHHLFGHRHNVFCAASLTEALSILNHQDIAVLITDTMVQGEETSYLIHKLKQTRPSIITVVLTTQADAHLIVRLINQGQIFRYLPKPVENHLLEFCINAALKHHRELQNEPAEPYVNEGYFESSVDEEDEEMPVAHRGTLMSLKDKLKTWRQRLSDFLRF